jgi:flagellar basal body-associated protein FliL
VIFIVLALSGGQQASVKRRAAIINIFIIIIIFYFICKWGVYLVAVVLDITHHAQTKHST